MDPTLLVDNGEVISYAAAGVLALIGLGIIQIFRRRGDVKKAREAVRLVTYSLSAPRPGPVAVKGVWHGGDEPHIDCGGGNRALDGAAGGPGGAESALEERRANVFRARGRPGLRDRRDDKARGPSVDDREEPGRVRRPGLRD